MCVFVRRKGASYIYIHVLLEGEGEKGGQRNDMLEGSMQTIEGHDRGE